MTNHISFIFSVTKQKINKTKTQSREREIWAQTWTTNQCFVYNDSYKQKIFFRRLIFPRKCECLLVLVLIFLRKFLMLLKKRGRARTIRFWNSRGEREREPFKEKKRTVEIKESVFFLRIFYCVCVFVFNDFIRSFWISNLFDDQHFYRIYTVGCF